MSNTNTPNFGKMTKKQLLAYLEEHGGNFIDANKPRIKEIDEFKGNRMVSVSEGQSRPKKMSLAVANRVVRAYLEDPEGVSAVLGLTTEVQAPQAGDA